MENLLQQQQELEEASLSLGSQRFRSRLEQARSNESLSEFGAAKKLLKDALEPLEQGIRDMTEREGRGRRHVAVKWCRLIGEDVAAYMTLKVVLNCLGTRKPLRRVAMDIAQLMVDELRYRRFRDEAPGLFKYVFRRFNTSDYRHKKRVLDSTIHRVGIDMAELEQVLTSQHRVLVGVKLIDILIGTTGLVQVKSRRRLVGGRRGSVKGELYLEPAEETIQWLNTRNDFLELLSPVNLPMVTPPLDWEPGKPGGYMFALHGKHRLVRRGNPELISQADMPEVYRALNIAQSTPWKINRSVLDLVNQIIERGAAMGGLPAMNDEPLPAKPADIDTNEPARRAWRRRAGEVKERNHTRRCQALDMMRQLAVIRQMAEHERFWFPMNLDFRGRMYPIPDYLSPQGDDLSKSLLMFAEGKPIGAEGAAYLAIHGANMLGEDPNTGQSLDKEALTTRINWVTKHSEEICQVAADPFTHRWWEQADKPLQFYAFCVEWARFKREGATMVSSLPVAMDGSCNGIQHFSAMLRDEVGGGAVNLLPADKPADLYQVIADRVKERLHRDSAEGDDELGGLADLWLTSGLVDRKLAKRPTMTFGYGSKLYGFTDQILEHLGAEGRKLFDKGDKNLAHSASSYMAHLLWSALETTVVAAHQTMGWMQTVARLVVKDTGTPLMWNTPTGFPITQEYFKTRERQIMTVLAGTTVRPRVFEATNEVQIHKQANAVAPNFVHGLDASALMLTINQSYDRGVQAFGMVHDSYSTIPADAATLGDVTREAFVQMYQNHNVIAEFQRDCLEQYEGADPLPDPPESGSLDITKVLESDYFFA